MYHLIKRTIAVLLLAAVPGTFGLGCGDSGSAESERLETSALTKTQFIKRANAICARGSEDLLESISGYMEENESVAQAEPELIADAIQAIALPELARQFDEIEDLGAPAGDRQQLEALLTALRRGIASAEMRREMSLVQNVVPDFKRSGKLARQYGIQNCAYG